MAKQIIFCVETGERLSATGNLALAFVVGERYLGRVFCGAMIMGWDRCTEERVSWESY